MFSSQATSMQALTLNKPIVILGDLNRDVSKPNCPESKALMNFATEMNHSQLINPPPESSIPHSPYWTLTSRIHQYVAALY